MGKGRVSNTFRILVTGSRDWDNRDLMDQELSRAYGLAWEQRKHPVLVHGHCPTGADAMADDLWTHGSGLEPERHPADWKPWGPDGSVDKTAGFKRNQLMVDLGADVCLAFHVRGAKNNGTKHCRDLAIAALIKTRIIWSDGHIFEFTPDGSGGMRERVVATP